jgi:tRNA-Thr(GGU) m(6)t(6)A37 methyltransferase TsaA
MSYTFHPIGVVRSPFRERAEAPRQARAEAGRGVEGSIELFPGHDYETALSDLETWERVWVLFVFHLNANEERGWKPKVLPPRSEAKRGLFATRSPHRPNPIGMSAVRLVGVEELVVRVKDLDILDGTPVLDLKPYVAYADAFPEAKGGWLDAPPADPGPAYTVEWEPLAEAQLVFLRDAHGVDLRDAIARTLALGPQPHAYRRIRKDGDALRLALKEWRVRFRVDGRRVLVSRIDTGYRERQLAEEPALEAHRAFVEKFGR